MTSRSTEKKDLDKAFKLIEDGHTYRKACDHWSASQNFAEAVEILETLYQNQEQQTSEGGKIAKLYHQKAVDYLQSARLSLVAALQREAEDDDTPSPTVETGGASSSALKEKKDGQRSRLSNVSKLLKDLDEIEGRKRLDLFNRLFATEPILFKNSNSQEAEEDATSNLEQRLIQLNSSIPHSLKTESERMRDLNQGLRRLGLATVPTSETKSSNTMFDPTLAPPKSEDDQVLEIIHQAKDEVNLNGGTEDVDDMVQKAAKGIIPEQETNIDSDDDVSDDVDNNDDDVDLTADTCRSIHEKLLSIEVTLAELIALFEVDDGGDAEIEFDQQRGRHLLRSAEASLKVVRQKWNAAGES